MILTVLMICAPVFALVAAGRWLVFKGRFSQPAREFCTWLVWTWCLPALIVREIMRQDFIALINVPVIGSTVIATLLAGGMAVFAARRAPDVLRGPLSIAPFWANLTYLGFPDRAFGSAGLGIAAIVNAFTMPLFVMFGSMLLVMCASRRRGGCILASDLAPGGAQSSHRRRRGQCVAGGNGCGLRRVGLAVVAIDARHAGY